MIVMAWIGIWFTGSLGMALLWVAILELRRHREDSSVIRDVAGKPRPDLDAVIAQAWRRR